MEHSSQAAFDKQRWWALSKINGLSVLSQIVQIGTVTPLLSLSLEARGVSAAHIGVIVSASWLAIVLLYKLIPRLLGRLGLVNTTFISALLSVVALIGMANTQSLVLVFGLNFLLGAGLILRWIACDTWIVCVATQNERGRAIGVHETLMGLGIAVGPLLLVVFGVDGAAPYYACAALITLSAGLGLSLKTYDQRPRTPPEKRHSRLFRVIPVALCAAFVAGFCETSSASFLGPYSLSAGYALTAATLLIAVFGAGGTLLQLPIGWLADKSSYKTAQQACALVVLAGTVAIPFSQSIALLSAVLVFVWGGAIGGMNTLAVIEAGARVEEHQMSTAMTAIAMFYTLGSVLGPIATGTIVSSVNDQGLMICVAVATGLFIVLMMKKPAPLHA